MRSEALYRLSTNAGQLPSFSPFLPLHTCRNLPWRIAENSAFTCRYPAASKLCPISSGIRTYVMLELLCAAGLGFVMVEGQVGGDYTSSTTHQINRQRYIRWPAAGSISAFRNCSAQATIAARANPSSVIRWDGMQCNAINQLRPRDVAFCLAFFHGGTYGAHSRLMQCGCTVEDSNY